MSALFTAATPGTSPVEPSTYLLTAAVARGYFPSTCCGAGELVTCPGLGMAGHFCSWHCPLV